MARRRQQEHRHQHHDDGFEQMVNNTNKMAVGVMGIGAVTELAMGMGATISSMKKP
jgi:hypothetical protein